MKKKIGIVELDYHFEVLLNTLLIFKNLDYDLYVFTKASFAEHVMKITSFDGVFVTMEKNESLVDYLKKNEVLLNQMDLLIFDTFELHFKEISNIKLSTKSVVRVHNVHTYFSPVKHIRLTKNFYYLLVGIKYILKNVLLERELKYRKKFCEKVSYFTFPADIIKHYAVEKNFVSIDRVAPTIPFILYLPEFKKEKETDTIYITLPGNIDLRRRNYPEFLKALFLIKDKINQKVELTFLGKPKNKYELFTIKKFKSVENDFIKFRYYEKWIPQDDFDTIMKKTDFFVVPLFHIIEFRLFGELYGYSKMSGSINDIIKYGKPSLVSNKYPLEDDLEKLIQRYGNATELAEHLLDWIENRSYKKLNENVSEALELYSVDNSANTMDEIIKSLTE